MPIRVRIDINGTDLTTLWIGRLEGGTNPDDINTYAVGEAGPYGIEPWNLVRPEELPHFEHRYGDGHKVLVQKALERWNGEDGE